VDPDTGGAGRPAQRGFLPRLTGNARPRVRARIIAAMVSQVLEPQDSRAGVRRTLEVHGIRATAQRIRMAEVLLAAPCHMTAEQVLAALRRSAARVSKATVYNTLKLFVEHGLVRQVHLDPDRCVYDSTREPHHHFQNLDTGEMIDIRPEDLAFARMPSLPPGTEIAGVDVVIRLRRRL
jgi:Fur family iron response transcriptional regulator